MRILKATYCLFYYTKKNKFQKFKDKYGYEIVNLKTNFNQLDATVIYDMYHNFKNVSCYLYTLHT